MHGPSQLSSICERGLTLQMKLEEAVEEFEVKTRGPSWPGSERTNSDLRTEGGQHEDREDACAASSHHSAAQ